MSNLIKLDDYRKKSTKIRQFDKDKLLKEMNALELFKKEVVSIDLMTDKAEQRAKFKEAFEKFKLNRDY